MQIFDSHTHLNDTPYAGQEADFIAQAAELRVVEMAIVGSDTVLNEGALRLAAQYEPLSALSAGTLNQPKIITRQKKPC